MGNGGDGSSPVCRLSFDHFQLPAAVCHLNPVRETQNRKAVPAHRIRDRSACSRKKRPIAVRASSASYQVRARTVSRPTERRARQDRSRLSGREDRTRCSHHATEKSSLNFLASSARHVTGMTHVLKLREGKESSNLRVKARRYARRLNVLALAITIR